MAYTKYSLTPANNTATPPDGAPEGMLPSAVNDTMRDMMAQIRDCGDGIRDGTYTMTAPKITGGTITGATVTSNTFSSSGATITGGTINGTTIGATTASTGKFTAVTNSALTSGRVTYAGTSGVLQDDADFTFNGTTVTMANDASISGLTVGKGGGAVATATVVGNGAMNATNSGADNTAIGYVNLRKNTSGANNTGLGSQAFSENTTGSNNTAIGRSAMSENTTGGNNTAVGNGALVFNTTASNNTAVGYQAGYSTTTGARNAFGGYVSGYANTTGTRNTGFGPYSLFSNTTGNFNTAVGDIALYTTTGSYNTAIGIGAGELITTGSKNTIIGGYNGNQGSLDIRTASNYIVLSDGDGNPRAYWDSSGTTWIPALFGQTSASAANLLIGASGNLARSTSALKYKQDIRDLPSKNINALRAVVYKSKCQGDDQTKDHFGIIADEANQAGFKELVSFGADGEVEGFQYERLTVVLLKAVQELNAKVEALEAQLNK